MENLFGRSKELDRVIDFGENSYRTKDEQRAFEKYVCALKRSEYRKIAETHIITDPKDSENYIRTLISLICRLNDTHSALTRRDQEQLFQALALFCVRPRLFFNKFDKNGNNSTTKHGVKKFEKELERFNREWALLASEIQLCKRYMFRGTRDLDRDASASQAGKRGEGPCPKLTSDEEHQLEDILNGIYRAYYYELRAVGLCLPTDSPPCVDRKLLHNCLEKPWLLPLSHVILIRDAQCKMMGQVKYKKEALFFKDGRAKELDLTGLSEQERYSCGTLTYVYTLHVRAAFAKALDKKLKSDCKAAFANFFKKEYQEIKQKNDKMMKELPRLSAILGPSNVYASLKFQGYMAELDELDATPFSVPDCHIVTFALCIAAKLELNVEQLHVIIRELPKLFWDVGSIKSWLDKINIFDGEAASKNKDLQVLLSPVYSLLNPKEYFSTKKDEEDLSASLNAAAKKLNSQFETDKETDSMKKLWSVFHDILFFHDLTQPALLLSGAVDLEYCPECLLLNLVRRYSGALANQLKKYKKGGYKRKILELEPLSLADKNELTELQKSPDYDEPKRLIIEYLIETGDIEKMTLEMACSFWSRPDFSAHPPEGLVKQLMADVEARAVGFTNSQISSWPKEKKEHMCLIVYSQIIDHSIALIKKKSTDVLLKSAFNLLVNTDSAEGGKS